MTTNKKTKSVKDVEQKEKDEEIEIDDINRSQGLSAFHEIYRKIKPPKLIKKDITWSVQNSKCIDTEQFLHVKNTVDEISKQLKNFEEHINSKNKGKSRGK